MAHVNESDASADADSTAYRVRASVSPAAATAASAAWDMPSFAPTAPAFAHADDAAQPSSFAAASAR
jgi:hypothetical protein